MSAPLYALILAGGESRRMGTDKGTICYHELPQVLHLYHQLSQLTARCYISIQPQQANRWFFGSHPIFSKEQVAQSGVRTDDDLLHDLPEFSGSGPLSGVLTAMTQHPEAAWLVTGCDYPLLTTRDYKRIIDARSETHAATVVLDPFDARPLPMPAIFEPELWQPFLDVYKNGNRSMRVVLQESSTNVVTLEEPRHLQSIDHPAQMEIVQLLHKK